MAHIVDFSILGLAGRTNSINYKLNRGVNIFFGLNGSGKTTLLKILHAAMSNNIGIIKNAPFKAAEVNIHSLHYDKIFNHKVKKDEVESSLRIGNNPEFIQKDNITKSNYNWEVSPNMGETTSWKHNYLPISRYFIGNQGTFRGNSIGFPSNNINEEEIEENFAEALQLIWADCTSQIFQRVNEVQERGLANILKIVLSKNKKPKNLNIDADMAYKRVKRFLNRQGSNKILGQLDDFKERIQSDIRLNHVVNDIDNVEQHIEDAMKPRVALQSLVSRLISKTKTIQFRDRSIDVLSKNKANIGLQSLSAGEKQLLRILIETILAEDNTILIDEPELSMHIDWQKELISAMQTLNPNVQIVIATHSPEIMADIDDSSIFNI